MPKLSEPQSRRQPPEAETRSVEEVLLHRRLAQMRGDSGFRKMNGKLPDEVYAVNTTLISIICCYVSS